MITWSHFFLHSKEKESRWRNVRKTVLQQLQEIFPMEVNREEADAGEKIRLRNDEQK